MKITFAAAFAALLIICPLSARAQQPGNATGQSAVPGPNSSNPPMTNSPPGAAQPKVQNGAAKPPGSSLPATHPHAGAPATDPATNDEMYAPHGSSPPPQGASQEPRRP
ncbi:MAG TPA: hypothetical protein VM689_06920 [Aliidongia sp.]|nr:hypothetical protein [Aliidongia sp.]